MAEALLRHHLRQVGARASVSSAGSYVGGQPATDHAVEVMAARGLDLSTHRSRPVDGEMIRDADLVIGMTRAHVREAAVLEPDGFDRVFTLKELVAGAQNIGPRRPSEPLLPWIRRIAGRRERRDLLGVGYDESLDVADPVGLGRDEYERTAQLLDDLLTRFVALAYPARDHEEVGA
jgi:protein-tyrosine phosphatase